MLNLKQEYYVTVFVNGKPFNCLNSMSIKDLLLYLDFDLDLIIVEYNNEIINLSSFDIFSLNMNDSIEVITIVGGG
uniref:Thiamin biosynthesis protein S n=1 Tax=Thuretia quercifolia TaxID=189650 RepID=A0A1Z1MKC0_9FLOR|nr:thiamin biosynthesis protein S [Thuretia quercifolia]ARW66513.1 thiamin biosynthesis protein S [Thuretia quercifolia]